MMMKTLPLIHSWTLKRAVRGMCVQSTNSSVGRQLISAIHNVAAESSSSLSPSSSSSLCDFLCANKFGKKFLIGCYGSGLVLVETLRGKILALYLAKRYRGLKLPSYSIDFYNTLKRSKPDAAFEMIHVASRDYDPSLFDAVVSKLPCLAVPCHDLEWRSYLFDLYYQHSWGHIVVIDTRDNKIRVLSKNTNGDDHIYSYGPLGFPFTSERIEQLKAQCKQLEREETSISAILGSDSCDYLMDPQSNKVPISSLQNKDVLIYGFMHNHQGKSWLVSQLREIHNKFQNRGVEIVSINLNYNGGDGEYETLWEDHLEQISWLHLPVIDEKIWLLRTMMDENEIDEYFIGPILCVKSKGESLIYTLGYLVLQQYGFQAFPFTQKAAAQCVLTRLRSLSFKSFVDEARHLGLHFNSLIRNKADGGTEFVSLLNILEAKTCILILFASLENCSRESLNSLVNVYLSQNESSFEVIFVSLDEDSQSFHDHFSVMPWVAFHRPLEYEEYDDLHERTTQVRFWDCGHFLAFGSDQFLVQVGKLTGSLQSCVFPFVNDDESTDFLADCI